MSLIDRGKQKDDRTTTEISNKRWIIWASLMAIYIVGCIHRVAPAVMAKDLMATFKTSATMLGALSSVYFYTYALMQIPSGIFSDTLGPRKTVTVGAVVMGIGTTIFALASSLVTCFVGRLLIGFGASVVMVNTMRVCVEWYKPNEMGLINGLTTTVGALGTMLAATPLAVLSEFAGLRLSLFLMGIATFFLAWNCWCTVRDRPGECVHNSQDKKAANQTSFSSPQSITDGIRTVFKNPYTWPPFFGFFSFYSTLMAFSGLWGVPFLSHVYGLSNKEAANYMMMISFGLLVGCPVTGYISDKVLGLRRLPYVTCALAYSAVWGIVCFFTIQKTQPIYLYIICFFMGFFCSGFTLSLVASKEANMQIVSGIAMGTTNTGGFLGAALLQIVLGKVLDLFWEGATVDSVRFYPPGAYRVAFLICFLVTLGGFVASLYIKETHCRNWP